MKKIMSWLFGISLSVFIIDWLFVGLQLLDGDYDITTGAYIALAALIVLAISGLYLKLQDKCPHCGKLRFALGEYCPYCGKKKTDS